jgi:hypothetical protein
MWTLTKIIQEAVRRGKAEVLKVGYAPHKERGALAGFDKCLRLGSIEQFQAELERCEEDCAQKREIRVKGRGKQDEQKQLEDYWEARLFQAQVAHTYNLLCAVYHINKIPGYEKLPAMWVSAARLYAMIVGAKGMSPEEVENFLK